MIRRAFKDGASTSYPLKFNKSVDTMCLLFTKEKKGPNYLADSYSANAFISTEV